MKLPTFDRVAAATGLGTLLATVCTTLLARQVTPQGDVLLSKATLTSTGTGAVTVFVGLLSYLAILWRRDQKRERIRFAKEMGRRICNCSETGEIMTETKVVVPESGLEVWALVCPRCKEWKFPDEPKG